MPTCFFRALGCGSDGQCRAGAALKEFERFDKDNDGELDEKELHKMFDRWATPTSPSPVSFAII